MSEIADQGASLKPLLDKMVAGKQLSSADAEVLLRQGQPGAPTPPQGEADVLLVHSPAAEKKFKSKVIKFVRFH